MICEITAWSSTRSDVASQRTQRRNSVVNCQLIYIILLFLSLVFIGILLGLLIGKVVFNEEIRDQPSANWGGTVTQGGVEKPVLEAIVDMMNPDNIKENLRYFRIVITLSKFSC